MYILDIYLYSFYIIFPNLSQEYTYLDKSIKLYLIPKIKK